MNGFLRSLTLGLLLQTLWPLAAPASDSRVLMEEMTTTEVRDAIQRAERRC